MPKTRPANPGQVRVRIKWYVSRQSNFLALILTNSNCPDRTRMWRGLLLITNHALKQFFRQGCTRGDMVAADGLTTEAQRTRGGWNKEMAGPAMMCFWANR